MAALHSGAALSPPSQTWDWNIAVFCQNEQDTILRCLDSIEVAAQGRRVLVCLIVNGSSDESAARAIAHAARCTFDFVVATIAAGDKANAINVFNTVLRVPAATYIYIDGYVSFTPGSLQALAQALADVPGAVASTGVSTTGRTMTGSTRRTLEQGGVLHGQLHAFRPAFIDTMAARGIRLPLGIYWGDGLLGSMAAHNLDAMGQPWEDARIKGVAEAQYQIKSLSIFRPRDLMRQARRMVRQARGRLQNRAIKDVIYRDNYQGLPANADDMVREHIARAGLPRMPLAERPFLWQALREMRRARPIDPARLVPRIAYASSPDLQAHMHDAAALGG